MVARLTQLTWWTRSLCPWQAATSGLNYHCGGRCIFYKMCISEVHKPILCTPEKIKHIYPLQKILPPYLVQWMMSIMLPFWTLALRIAFLWLLEMKENVTNNDSFHKFPKVLVEDISICIVSTLIMGILDRIHVLLYFTSHINEIDTWENCILYVPVL